MKGRDDSIIHDYCQFSGVQIDVVRACIRRRSSKILEEWWDFAREGGWQGACRRFYDESRYYIYELLDSNRSAAAVEDKLYALDLGDVMDGPPLDILEYGSGLGVAGEVLARKGHRVVCADVAGAPMEFAKWRTAKRAIEGVTYADLKHVDIGELGEFDVVFSDAVMEHLLDPYGVCEELMKVVRLGGIMHHSIDVVNRGAEWPMHRYIDLGRLDAAIADASGNLLRRSHHNIVSRWGVSTN